ncbi:adenylate cyclase [Rhizobiales bacterium GAS191]|jgi:adenylate cyclase|nr:adenylate cyclase [Rhizobiales bacterium GAS113]SEC44682.1 adenylate cyclase [Rhizobiales bacterium GAS191]SEC81522.1 adenylate cyclase [Rhizobiales bacterium GAS188]
MNPTQFSDLAAWITEAGLAGKEEKALVAGFCERLRALGLPLARASVIVDTLHPIYEGRMFPWRHGEAARAPIEYGPTTDGDRLAGWQRSPFYRMLESGASILRMPVTEEMKEQHPIFVDLHEAGMKEFVPIISRFAAKGTIGEMDCVYSSWSTDREGGFDDGDIADLERLVPMLALAVKATSLTRIAKTLVETYLGRDAGRRVISGSIGRGVADRIEAALWFSDLHDYTRISDTAAPGQIIPFLNDYADAIISAIHEEGGDVLKLIGDGTLAIFTGENRGEACRAALAAAGRARLGVAELNQRRSAEELPTTSMYLGLHIGEVFFGNIGSKERLDFTVVGPAVNEVSRIAAMCRSVDQSLLASSSFAVALGDAQGRLVSVGRYALRGVGQPQDLFTLDPQAAQTSFASREDTAPNTGKGAEISIG